MIPSRPRPTLAFVVNVDWFFLSHRLPIARAARDAGCDVIVVAADTGATSGIEREGFRFVPLPLTRAGSNPLSELRSFLFLLRLYRRLRPDLVHHVTIKPVLYGSIAARLVGGMAIVNAVSGLGYLFTGSHRRGLRRLARLLYRVALGGTRTLTIFQNTDDRDEFVQDGAVAAARTRIIRGSGVDCARFAPAPEPAGTPVVLLPARMLRDKGVEDFVAAAGIVSARGTPGRFVLAGAADPENPASISPEQLGTWAREGVVEWWGHVADMAGAFRQARLVVLPSRREGLPKALLEAAASGRPIVATDVPGCREVVRHGVNGLLVPLGDPTALADAIERLLEDGRLRAELGRAGRALVLAELSEPIVVGQTLSVYRELLTGRWPDGVDTRTDATQLPQQ